MPLFYQHNINEYTKIGVWHIIEDEDFFLFKVPLKKEITHWHKRLQHLAGRYLLKHLFQDFPYDLIEIADTRKPFLQNEAYHFSISHCGDFAAAIVSKNSRVGIDIEIPASKVDKIKHKFLSTDEMRFLEYQNTNYSFEHISQVTKILTLLWSAKEAVFKWSGSGGVDFIDHIHLTPTQINTSGIINSKFLKGIDFPLFLNYKFFEPIVLVWVKSDI